MNAKLDVRLGITSNYAQHWKIWEGVREFVQNWHDGLLENVVGAAPTFLKSTTENQEVLYKAMSNNRELGKIIYNTSEKKIFLVNNCVSLHRKVLLLGYSRKPTHQDVVGQFGEGMKVGALALLRQGLCVSMLTSNDVWNFELCVDPAFDERVLTVSVLPQNDSYDLDILRAKFALEDQTVTIISGLSESDWSVFSSNFLFLEPATNSVQTEMGSLLFDSKYEGMLFVKGVWISNLTNMKVGVNFFALDVDRDRVASLKEADMEHQLSAMWLQAVRKRKDLVPKYFEILRNNEGSLDTKHAAFYATEDDAEVLGTYFLEIFGGSSIPLSTTGTDTEKIRLLSQDLQRKVVLCSATLTNILRLSSLPDSEMLVQTLLSKGKRNPPLKLLPTSSLSDTNLSHLLHALGLVNAVYAHQHLISIENIDISDWTADAPSLLQVSNGRYILSNAVFDSAYLHKDTETCSERICKCSQVMICLEFIKMLDEKSIGLKRNGVKSLISNLIRQVCLAEPEFCRGVHHCLDGCDMLSFERREASLLTDLEALRFQAQETETAHLFELEKLKKEVAKLDGLLLKEEVIRMNVTKQVRSEMEFEMRLKTKQLECELHVLQESNLKLDSENITIKRDASMVRSRLAELENRMQEISTCESRRIEVLHSRIHQYHRLLAEVDVLLQEDLNAEGASVSRIMKSIRNLMSESKSSSNVACVICLDLQINTVLLPCRHNVLCEGCANAVHTCPVCRSNISQKLKVFV